MIDRLLGKRCRRLGAAVVLLLVLVPSLCAATTAGDLNEAGKSAYGRGDFATAERLFGEAVSGAPNEPLFHYHRGAALLRLGRLAEARASYQRALSLSPPAPLAATIRAALHEAGPQPAGVRVSVGGTDAIRLELAHGVWFAQVIVNGFRQARFLVDTGATACAISPALVDELGIVIPDTAPVVQMMTLNGRTSGRLISLGSIRLGEAETTEVRTVVFPLPRGLEGILGNSFLGQYAVTLDAQSHLLHLRARQ